MIRVDKEEDRLGGAAAVAMIAAGLGARVTLAGVLGRDEPGRRLQQLITDHGIEPHLWIDDRPTTWKQRIVARGQLRPDRCDREVTTPISNHAAHFLSAVPLGDMVLVSDYGKGVCTRSLLRTLGDRARDAGVPILVDPDERPKLGGLRTSHVDQGELGEATEADACDNARPLALARKLSEQHSCDVVVTLGCHGMVCAERPVAVRYLPATRVEVRDVCGAGDTVLATLGVAIARGAALREACSFAVKAAAEQVSRFGIAPIRDAA